MRKVAYEFLLQGLDRSVVILVGGESPEKLEKEFASVTEVAQMTDAWAEP